MSEWIGPIVDWTTAHPPLDRFFVATLEFGALAVLVAATVRVGRIRSPRVVALLWVVVMAKPVVSLTVGAPAAIVHLVGSRAADVAAANMERVEERTTGVTSAGAARNAGPASSAAGSDVASRAATAVWAMGALWMALASVRARRRLAGIVRRSAAPGDGLLRLYAEVAGELGVRNPPGLRVATALESPALVRTIRPLVLLPSWMTPESDAARIRWSLRHELTHWRARDHWANALRELSGILFYFNPLVWWVGRKWQHAAEAACDAAIVADHADAKQYAEQLYRMLVHVKERRRVMLTSSLFATRTQIGRRIEALLRGSAPRRAGTGALAGVAVFALAGLAVGADLGPETARKGESRDVHEWRASIHETGDSHEFRMEADGDFRFNKDRTAIESIGPGGYFKLWEKRDGATHELRVEPDEDGTLRYEYEVDGHARPFDDEAREWLSSMLRKIRPMHRNRGQLI